MKRRWLILAGLYLYAELLLVFLPMLSVWWGSWLPEGVDRWLGEHYLATALGLFLAPTAVLLVAGGVAVGRCFLGAGVSRGESVALLKTLAVMRLVQIPGFVLSFVGGLVFLMTIFTFGFSLFFLLLDGASVVITGLFAVPVYRGLWQNGLLSGKRAVAYSLLSFVFCADVVVALVCYRQTMTLLKR